jgi:hypothetical protein
MRIHFACTGCAFGNGGFAEAQDKMLDAGMLCFIRLVYWGKS